jgi:hypothetical protein
MVGGRGIFATVIVQIGQLLDQEMLVETTDSPQTANAQEFALSNLDKIVMVEEREHQIPPRPGGDDGCQISRGGRLHPISESVQTCGQLVG